MSHRFHCSSCQRQIKFSHTKTSLKCFYLTIKLAHDGLHFLFKVKRGCWILVQSLAPWFVPHRHRVHPPFNHSYTQTGVTLLHKTRVFRLNTCQQPNSTWKNKKNKPAVSLKSRVSVRIWQAEQIWVPVLSDVFTKVWGFMLYFIQLQQ